MGAVSGETTPNVAGEMPSSQVIDRLRSTG